MSTWREANRLSKGFDNKQTEYRSEIFRESWYIQNHLFFPLQKCDGSSFLWTDDKLHSAGIKLEQHSKQVIKHKLSVPQTPAFAIFVTD